MAELMLWLLLSQGLSGFPAMQEGTRLQIVSPDLLTVYGEAVVADRQLVLQTALVPESEVKIIISYDNGNRSAGVAGGGGAGGGSAAGGSAAGGGAAGGSQKGEGDEATLEIYPGVVAPDGEDILLTSEAEEAPVSLREFLEEERDIRLFILPPDEG